MDEFITGIERMYPSKLLENRVKIEGNVISCMMLDLSRVNDDCITNESWFTKDAKFYYGLMSMLWKKGVTELSDVAIRTVIPEKALARYEENGGWDAIEEQRKLFQDTSTDTYESYKNTLCKENYICDLKKKGLFDATKEAVAPNGKTCIPYDLFKEMQTAVEVHDWYEAALSDFKIPESDKVNEQCYLEDFIGFAETCECGLENGVPFETLGEDIDGVRTDVYPFLSRQVLGFMEGTFNMMAGYSSTGKALTLDSDIMTPNGYIKMRDVKVGDLVTSDDGKAYHVLGVFPQGEKDVYKFTFEDGAVVEACKDHLWTIKVNGKTETLRTLDIVNNYHLSDISVPVTEPIEFNKKDDLSIDPYELGILVDYGYFTVCDVNGTEKFIPKEYKYSSIEERFDLLRGLLKIDGSLKRDVFRYKTTSKMLVDDITFVVESLGGLCEYYFDDVDTYTLFIRLPIYDDLERKIISIEYIGKKECQCITIDSPSHLFLTNHCVVTHNTSWWIGTIMSLLHEGRKILIISNEEKSRAFYARIIVYILYKYCKYFRLSKRKLLAGDVDEESMRQIRIAEEYFKTNYKGMLKFISVSEMDMKINKKLIKENVLKGGFDTVLFDTFKLDFNGTAGERTDLTLVRDSRELDAIAKKYNIIMLASLQLAMNSKGVLFLTSNQLSNSKQITEVLETLLMMRNVYPEELDKDNAQYYCKPFRKQLVDKLDEHGNKIVNKETGEIEREWENVPFEVPTDNGEVWRMLFVSKTRAGSNSEDTGYAYLLKYRGDYCVFSESCQCIPRHGFIQ